MDSQLLELDKVKWNAQEDDLLQKLHKHFQGDFNQVSIQMNSIQFYNKMTPALCEYRWKYYIDSNINRSEFNSMEENNMFLHLKKNDLYSNHFWFELQDQFQRRPPSVQKHCTSKFIQKQLIQLNEAYISNKSVKKRYNSRIKQFNIDILLCFFRLGKEKIKRTGPASLLTQAIEQCNQLLLYIEQMIQTKGNLPKYDDQNEQSSLKFHTMMECLIFIDTLYRVRNKIYPYNQGEQANINKMEGLLPKKQNGQADNNDDQCFEILNREDVRLIYQSEVLQAFNQYFCSNE